jgi:hypothetical protein
MDFEIEIVSTQQSYEIKLKWRYKTICSFYWILWKLKYYEIVLMNFVNNM